MRKLLVIVLLLILIDQCGRHARRSVLNEPVAIPAVSANINHPKPASMPSSANKTH